MMLSVITVTYKDPDGLARTLRSLVDVSGSSYIGEVLVIDSAPDISAAVIATYKQMLPLQHVTAPPEGIYAAMNVGWAMASRDILWFLNGGDEAATPEGLIEGMMAFEADPALGIFSSHAALTRNGEFRYFHSPPNSLRNGVAKGNGFCHQATLYRRSYISALFPFRKQFKLAADFDLHVRAYAAQLKYVAGDKVLANYDTSGASMNVSAVLADYERILADAEIGLTEAEAKRFRRGVRAEKFRLTIIKRLRASPIGNFLMPIWVRWKRLQKSTRIVATPPKKDIT